MIFQYTWEKVLAGQKTQTRRIVKPGEVYYHDGTGKITAVYVNTGGPQGGPLPPLYGSTPHHLRLKWQVGRTYAVQPGRGKAGIGRIKLTAIRKEGLLEISREDEIAEGFNREGHFLNTWNRIHNARGERVLDNPDVWVLEFELVKEPEAA